LASIDYLTTTLRVAIDVPVPTSVTPLMDSQLSKPNNASKITLPDTMTDETFEQISKELKAIKGHYQEIEKEAESMEAFREEMEERMAEFLKELDDEFAKLAEEETKLVQDIANKQG
jgi:predicted transcriptional regulator